MNRSKSLLPVLVLTIILGAVSVAAMWTFSDTLDVSNMAVWLDNLSFVILRLVLVVAGLMTFITVFRG